MSNLKTRNFELVRKDELGKYMKNLNAEPIGNIDHPNQAYLVEAPTGELGLFSQEGIYAFKLSSIDDVPSALESKDLTDVLETDDLEERLQEEIKLLIHSTPKEIYDLVQKKLNYPDAINGQDSLEEIEKWLGRKKKSEISEVELFWLNAALLAMLSETTGYKISMEKVLTFKLYSIPVVIDKIGWKHSFSNKLIKSGRRIYLNQIFRLELAAASGFPVFSEQHKQIFKTGVFESKQ